MQEKIRPKILMLYAHPDDELVWGWPILQNPAFEKEILICVSDAHNPQRRRFAHRVESLAMLCEHLKISWQRLAEDIACLSGTRHPD